LLDSAIARAIGLRDMQEGSLNARIVEVLRSRDVLLILDNFEHIVQAAQQVSGLLAACPDLKIVVTSRVRLRLSGEHEHRVVPLSLPQSQGGATERAPEISGAVQLFVQSAQQS